jgi:hypothetical protein
VNLANDPSQRDNVIGVGSHRLPALLAVEEMMNATDTRVMTRDTTAKTGGQAIANAERRITPQRI